VYFDLIYEVGLISKTNLMNAFDQIYHYLYSSNVQ